MSGTTAGVGRGSVVGVEVKSGRGPAEARGLVEFERESEALGKAAVFVLARDFVTIDPADRPKGVPSRKYSASYDPEWNYSGPLLTADEARRIAVAVIDVTKPSV